MSIAPVRWPAMDDLHAAVRAHAPLERCIELLEVVRSSPEGTYLPIQEAPVHFTQDQEWWLLFDPRPVLQAVRCPVLALFGELDRVGPVPESVEIFETWAARAKNDDVTIRVFPGADHRILIDDDFAPGYFQTLTGWIVGQPSRRAAS
jgi:pimeloyl-ACP methyl ester carboxylesterase